jgi:GWxTD domain-containing protein
MKILSLTYHRYIYNVIPVPKWTGGIQIFTLCLLIIHLTGLSLVADEDIPARSSGELDFYIDYAIFNQQKDNYLYCEFYVMLYAAQIEGELLDDDFMGRIEIQKNIIDIKTGRRKEDLWQTEIRMDQDSVRNSTLAVYDQWADYLEPARYQVDVTIKDLKSHSQGNANFYVSLIGEDYKKNISQIQFVSHVEKSKDKDQFFKNGRKIYPNPSRRYGLLSPNLFFYYELYDLDKSGENYIDIVYSIIGEMDSLKKTYPPKRINILGKTLSVVHGIDISRYPSGIYKLRITSTDNSRDLNLESERRFEIIQQDQLIGGAKVNADQIKIAANVLTYFISPQQLKLFNSLDIDGKTQFLINFWTDKDPTPGSKKNEYLEEIQRRYHYANEHFKWGQTEGWASDKGRVLIIYGFPEETIQKYSDPETVPYEIWIYHEDRRYEFVFTDMNSTGNFILIHSTKENEIHNEQWQELINRI